MQDLRHVTVAFRDLPRLLEVKAHEALGIQFLGHVIQHTASSQEAQPATVSLLVVEDRGRHERAVEDLFDVETPDHRGALPR